MITLESFRLNMSMDIALQMMKKKNKKNKTSVTISLDDFVLLLEDRAFVDYFNIFQSLPVSKLVHFL
jgi:hypothetical protein